MTEPEIKEEKQIPEQCVECFALENNICTWDNDKPCDIPENCRGCCVEWHGKCYDRINGVDCRIYDCVYKAMGMRIVLPQGLIYPKAAH